MKLLVSAALVAAQTVTIARPAFAAEIQRETAAASGTFAGLRLRVPMGGSRAERAPRLGLAFAPTVHSINQSGEARMRIGEGVEFGFSARRPAPALSIAGRRLGAAQEGQNGGDRRRGGISTGEAILIAGGVVVLVAGAGLLWLVNEINENSE